MGKIIKDHPCPACRENGHDSAGNHLLEFDDGGKYCPKKEHHISVRPYKEGVGNIKALVEAEDRAINTSEIKGIDKLPTTALKGRGISEKVASHYGTRVEYSSKTGEEKAYFCPVTKEGKIIAYKKRLLPKSFYWVGSIKGKKPELFGQAQCQPGGKKLLITEGYEDMAAACQMLWAKYPDFVPNVVSLIHGDKATSVSDNIDFVSSFDEVLIYTDKDDAGKKVGEEIAKLVGAKALMVTTTEKDANDMLKKGKQKEFINAFFQPQPYAPEGFITVDDIFEEATAMPTWGKSWPWPTLTKKTYGRRLGEGAYFGAGVKIGKSEAVNQIVHHVTQVEKGKIAVFKLEEKPAMTIRKIAGKIKHKQFHIPDGDFTQEELIDGVNAARSGVVLYDSYGATSWDTLKVAIRHAVLVEGCEDIIIDPLTRLTAGMDSSAANTELDRIADEISTMAKDLGFFYMIFAHLKAPQNGRPHEEGGQVHSNQFTGSRAMMRAAYYFIGIQRNKLEEDPVLRNTSTFVLLEDRAFGNSGSFEVFFDRSTGDYLEPKQKGY